MSCSLASTTEIILFTHGSACKLYTERKLRPVAHRCQRTRDLLGCVSHITSARVCLISSRSWDGGSFLSVEHYFTILSVPLTSSAECVYEYVPARRDLCRMRPSNIRPFMDRMKLLVAELDLPNVNIQIRIPSGG
ncbi:hypothetical protein TNCV_2083051 [Trichonephila clavipes]|nr:hypothetical protein TNCV_2083051 [Trichonephila clavipes]